MASSSNASDKTADREALRRQLLKLIVTSEAKRRDHPQAGKK